jgi:hypothetical protein
MEGFKWIKTISSSLHPISTKPAPESNPGDYPHMPISNAIFNLRQASPGLHVK